MFSPEGSPVPGHIDKLSVSPFPILIQVLLLMHSCPYPQNGATVSVEALLTSLTEVKEGATAELSVVLEGIIPIEVPCLEIEGFQLGSW